MTRGRRLRVPAACSSRNNSRRTESRSNVVEAPSRESEETPDSSSSRRRAIFWAVVSVAMPGSLCSPGDRHNNRRRITRFHQANIATSDRPAAARSRGSESAAIQPPCKACPADQCQNPQRPAGFCHTVPGWSIDKRDTAKPERLQSVARMSLPRGACQLCLRSRSHLRLSSGFLFPPLLTSLRDLGDIAAENRGQHKTTDR